METSSEENQPERDRKVVLGQGWPRQLARTVQASAPIKMDMVVQKKGSKNEIN